MKKLLVMGMVVYAAVVSAAIVCAEEAKSPAIEKQDAPAGRWMHRNKGAMMGGMMKCMSDKSLVATSDGGVVVLVGHKLIKFDKDLNVVKEVEIGIDVEEMKKICPMMGRGMMDDSEPQAPGTPAAKEAPAKPEQGK